MYGYIKAFPAGIPEGFDFIECLLFGALISATDPGEKEEKDNINRL